MSLTIREKQTGTVLASAPEGSELVVPYEGNLYFDPSAVEDRKLHVSDRTYTCPIKGVCHWVDFVGEDGAPAVRDVGWIYQKVKPGHEAIQGKFGFYKGTRGGTRQDQD